METKLDDIIERVSQKGDWLLLENLHLASDRIPELQEIMGKLHTKDINNRFRLWFSTVAVKGFNVRLLQSTIKVALQPPYSIKLKMDRMFME
jgi:dynein heavy chain